MKYYNKKINCFLIITFLTIISACGGESSGGGGANIIFPANQGENSDSQLIVKGKLGSGYTTGSAVHSMLFNQAILMSSGSVNVDKVVGLPIETPFVASPDIMKNAVTSEIKSDGSFEISIDTSQNWILLLIDSTKDKKNQIVSFAALGDSGSSDTMILIPASDAVSNIDMGTLVKSGDEGFQSGSMSDNLSNFSLNLSDLRQIAKNDNILKTIKNIYINYDQATEKFYSLLLPFWWDADTSVAKNKFSLPGDYTFSGYQPHFNSRNDTTFSYYKVNVDYYVTITLPSTVTDTNGNTYTEISSKNYVLKDEDRGNGNRCLFPDLSIPANNPFAFAFSINSSGWIQISAGGNRFTNLVNGMWILKKAGLDLSETEVAAFDLGVCSPISSSGKPYVYLPSLKVNVDPTTSKILSFEIEWYIYNSSTGVYDKITDFSIFEKQVEWVGMSFNDLETPGNSEIDDFESVTTKIIYPKGNWKFTDITFPVPYTSGSGRAFDIYSIRLGYRMYGVDFQVDFRVKP